MEEIQSPLDRQEAEAMQSADAEMFRGTVPPGSSLKAGAPNPAVMRLVHGMLSDPKSIKRADGLSRILRTLDAHRSFYLEYVCGSPPYGQLTPHLRVTLRNVSTRSISVITSVRTAPIYESDGSVSSQRWRELPIRHRLQPNEEITVPAERAVHVLQKHSQRGTHPQLWSRGKKDDIIEVGYRANWIDENRRGEAIPTEVVSPPPEKRGSKNAVRSKGQRGDDQP